MDSGVLLGEPGQGEVVVKVENGMDTSPECVIEYQETPNDCTEEMVDPSDVVVKVENGMDTTPEAPFVIKYQGMPNCTEEMVTDPLDFAPKEVQLPSRSSIKRKLGSCSHSTSKTGCQLKSTRKSDLSEPDDGSRKLEEPPKKIRAVEPARQRLTVPPPIKYSFNEVNMLWQGTLMYRVNCKRDRHSDVALLWTEKYMKNLRNWAVKQLNIKRKLSFFRLRLESAKLAYKMGRGGFRLNDYWFNKIRNQWRDFIRKDAVLRDFSVKGCDKGDSRVTEFYKTLVEWYDESPLKFELPPGKLERKAEEIAAALDVEIQMGKPWIKAFISKFGLYCKIEGSSGLYAKPSKGLLVHHFELAFHEWYYQFPDTLGRVKLKTILKMDYMIYGCLRNFLFAALEGHFEKSETDPKLHVDENEIIETICGSSSMTREILAEWHCKWSLEWHSRVVKITEFSDDMAKWYTYEFNTKGNPMNNERLEMLRYKCSTLAKTLQIQDFVFNERWFVRFLDMNGFCIKVGEETVMYNPGEIARLSDETIHDLLDDVREFLAKEKPAHSNRVNISLQVSGGSSLERELTLWYMIESKTRDVNYCELFSKANSLSKEMHEGERVGHRWMLKFLESHGLRRVPRKGYSVVFHFPTRTVTDPDPTISNFERALLAWYENKSKKDDVLPYLVECEAHSTALRHCIKDFVPTKDWLAKFTARHGLQFIIKGERVLIPKPNVGLFCFIFDAAFESWYAGFTTRGDFDLDEYFNNVNLPKDRKRQKATFEQYMTEVSKNNMADPNPEEVQVVEEIAAWAWNRGMVRQEFDGETHRTYTMNTSLAIAMAQTLHTKARSVAARVGLQDFSPTELWTKRFVQRYGLISRKHVISLDALSPRAPQMEYIFKSWFELPNITRTVTLMGSLGCYCLQNKRKKCFS